VSAAAITLRGVSKRYGTHLALRPTDLEIAEGEFFCLLGPSGCGKTTTLNLIGGFVAPTTGEILIRDRRVDRLPPHLRPVNTVFQSYALFPHMTVRNNVAFGLRMARVPKTEASERIATALELVGLELMGDRLPGQLSGGQQQRVAVARALVNRPAVLLLDEPLGALDLKLRQRLQLELAQIHREVGTTFVYVTHDQEEAMSMADRIAVMNEGTIEQLGSPSEIYRRPTSRFVADFIGDANFFQVRVEGDGAIVADGTRVPCAGGRADGPATLMLRPESLHIVDRAGAPAGALPARALQSAFLGRHVRVSLATRASSAPLTVSLQGTATALPEPDAGVAVWWAPEDAILLEPHDANGAG
jgi:spermidine/putrescine transport system ATP-binding protein